MMNDWKDKVAVVTGGASGIGRALGMALARKGVRVVLADIERERLDKALHEMQKSGLEAEGIVTNVMEEESVESLADRVFERYGNVHFLFNNAGVGLKEAQRRLWTLPAADWRWGFGVNVFGVVHGIRAFVPRMLKGGDEGYVINTSSGNGGLVTLPTTPIYAATKAAVTSISETLNYQLQMEDSSIRCSVLFPGPNLVNTNILNSSRNKPQEFGGPQAGDYASMEQLANSSGIEFKLTEPEDVANFALEGLEKEHFWLLPPNEKMETRLRNRTQSILNRQRPTLETF